MRRLICKSGNLVGREISLPPGTLRVGRHPENEIQIEDPSVSSFHCELEVAEIGVGVRDLGSTNGTFINRKQVVKGLLHAGDLLTLGQVDFLVELPAVHVALPEIQVTEPTGAAFLADGAPACFNHRDSPALFRCTKCEAWWCGECVRTIKRLSGDFLVFCPECSAACERIVFEKVAAKKGLFTRISETIRVSRKK
jgi:hypothetical protein